MDSSDLLCIGLCFNNKTLHKTLSADWSWTGEVRFYLKS